MTTKKIILNSTQIAVANRLGISPEVYAKSMAVVFETEEQQLDPDNPNNNELCNAPISTLRDLWLTKFGTDWVVNYSVDDDDKWGIISHRLFEYQMLESDVNCEWRKLREEV